MSEGLKTFRVCVDGTEYEIPATQEVFNKGLEASGVSLMDAFSGPKFGFLLQGVIYAGLVVIGIKEISGQKLTYKLIGKVCNFAETQENTLAFALAMKPDAK